MSWRKQNELEEKVNKVELPRSKPTQNQGRKESSRTYKFCLRHHPFGRDFCIAWGKKCNKCQGLNHFAKSMDDYLVYGRNVQEHDENLRNVSHANYEREQYDPKLRKELLSTN